MNAEGFGGELRCGWAVAARLGAWRMAPADEGWEIHHAPLLDVDPYWVTQRPLILRLTLGGVEWTWRDVEIDGANVIRVRTPPQEGVREVEQEQVRHP